MTWQRTPLDSLKSDDRYAFVGGPFGSELTTRDYVAEGVPVIRGNNLASQTKFVDDDFVFVSDQKARALASNMAHPGDLIFTQRGTLGQVGIIPKEARFERYVVSQSQMKLTVNEEEAAPLFLYHYFRLPSTVRDILSRVSSSGVPHINLGTLKAFEVPLPPLPVQKAIVNIAEAYDALMENNRRRMALLEEAARLLFREWFVHFRYPGHEHVKIKDGVPEGWKRVPLTEVAAVNRQSLPSSFDGEILYIDIASVEPGRITEKAPMPYREAPSRAKRVLAHGDVLWSCVRPNRRSHAIVWNPEPNLIGSTGFAVLTPTTVPTSYLYAVTTTNEFVGYLANNAQGAAYPAVTASVFERALVLVPPDSLLEDYDRVVRPSIELADKLLKQTSASEQARDLLLPRLMSGELEV